MLPVQETGMSSEQTDARMVADYYRAKTPVIDELTENRDERLECIPNNSSTEYATTDAWHRETARDDITNGFG